MYISIKPSMVGRMFSSLPADIKHTGLYDWHIENKGNMVEFAGKLYIYIYI